jgi:branched-chain amino acid transport system substrate-binding protein
MKFLKTIAAVTFAAAAALAVSPASGDQGVSDDEIVVGSVSDLSGIFAAFGAPAMSAAQMHFDAVNAAGGIHGRKIRFVVEDSGYQMPKAMQAYNKLINRDKVFAMLLSLGTPMNIAGMKLMTPKNIPNIVPLTAARQMLEEPIRLRFVGSASYYDQTRLGARYLAEQRGASKACTMFIPSDFGKEIEEAMREEAASNPALEYVAETTHKPDETDFVGSLQKLNAEGCELIGLALGIRQVITVLGTAKKLGLAHLTFLGSSGSFHTVLAKVPGGVTEGLFAAAGWVDLAARADEPEPAAFIAAYKEKFGEFPGTTALIGYIGATGFTRVLEKAGRDLTVDSFVDAMESLDYYDGLTDNRVSYSPDDHVGAEATILSVVEGGRWKEVARLK